MEEYLKNLIDVYRNTIGKDSTPFENEVGKVYEGEKNLLVAYERDFDREELIKPYGRNGRKRLLKKLNNKCASHISITDIINAISDGNIKDESIDKFISSYGDSFSFDNVYMNRIVDTNSKLNKIVLLSKEFVYMFNDGGDFLGIKALFTDAHTREGVEQKNIVFVDWGITLDNYKIVANELKSLTNGLHEKNFSKIFASLVENSKFKKESNGLKRAKGKEIIALDYVNDLKTTIPIYFKH